MIEVLAILHSCGGQVTDHEVAYQLAKRNLKTPDLLGVMTALEEQGLVRSQLRFAITAAGRDALAAKA